MSMQNGYLTLIAYDASLERQRRKRSRRQRARVMKTLTWVLLAFGGGIVWLMDSNGLI